MVRIIHFNKKHLLALMLLISSICIAQTNYTIQGHIPNFPNSKYELKRYNGIKQSTLTTAQSKKDGKFVLTYPAKYTGAAQLYMNGSYLTFFILNKENSLLYWKDLTNRDEMKLTGSKEYEVFLKGMKTFQDAEAKLAGLHYLVPLYAKDSLKQKQFKKELDVVANAFSSYVKKIPDTLFARQYLLTKGLIEQMPKTVETYKWRAPSHILEFMAIDFKAIKHAGLYKDVLLGYTNLVTYFPIEDIDVLLKNAIDKVVLELATEPVILENITQYWLTLLNKKSLFTAAEYLNLTMQKKMR